MQLEMRYLHTDSIKTKQMRTHLDLQRKVGQALNVASILDWL